MLVTTGSLAKDVAPNPQSASRGFFALRFESNATQISLFFGGFDQLKIAAEDPQGKTQYFSSVNALIQPGTREQASLDFGGWLPPGRYHIVALSANAGSMSTEADVHEALPSFDIVAGQVLDLGIVIFQPIGGGKAVLLPTLDTTPTAQALQRSFASDAAALSGLTTSVWDGATRWVAHPFAYGGGTSGLGLLVDALNSKAEHGVRLDAQARWQKAVTASDFLTLGKAATTRLNGTAVVPDGTMYLGSALGQVLRRSPDGQWQNLDTGRIAEISSVAVTEDSTVLAGTEYGELLRSSGSNGSFVPVGSAPDHGRIVDIRRIPGPNWLVVSRQVSDKLANLNIYIATSVSDIFKAPPKAVTQSRKSGFWSGMSFVATPALGKTGYFVSVPGSEVQKYDFVNHQWSQTAEGKSALPLLVNNSGTVFYSQLSPRVSYDEGQSWLQVKPGRIPSFSAFFDDQSAVSLVNEPHAFSADESFFRTTDGGHT